MDFKIKRKSVKLLQSSNLIETYPHDLQMYKIPPNENIRLQEFESLALERLTLLRTINVATTLKGLRMYSDDWKHYIVSELKANGLKHYAILCERSKCDNSEQDILQARRKDHISHFVLRLAYCRTEELRRWFIARELELFKMRFAVMYGDAVDAFFKINNLCYTYISDEEKNSIMNYLLECTQESTEFCKLKFYKVKFYEVLDLVKARRAYLRDGYAYISQKDFISVLAAQFKKHLRQSLAIACHHLGEIEQDDRLVSLLSVLPQSYTGNDYTNSKAVVPIESLDSLSVKSFPLCMRQLHEYLRAVHHLKHGGRLQYGLFLKGIGVTLEDSLRFWREEFTKIMDVDKFEKSYSYNVRYNYGKEGSKKDYQPFNCMRIINETVGPGDCHGCPYKHSDITNLKNKLQGYGLESQAIHDIVDTTKRGHFQIACSKYFDAVHSVNLSLGINHPNQFFEESQKLNKTDIKVLETKKEKTNFKQEALDEEMDIDFNISELN